MNRFKPGDIVRCLRHRPLAAGIREGELAIINEVRKHGGIAFYNYPVRTRNVPWLGDEAYFELYDDGIKENE